MSLSKWVKMNSEKAKPTFLLIILLISAFTILAYANKEISTFNEEELYQCLNKYERECYQGLRFLLNDYQKKHYLTLNTRKKRDQWRIKFWKMNDPVPGTKKNERRIEHKNRVKLAKERYSKDSFPGLDHRGETLIRFGEPDMINEVSADLVSLEQRVDHFRLKMPGEVWHYNILGLIVPFEQVKLDGECIYYMEINTIDRGMRDLLTSGENYLLADGWAEFNEYLNYAKENLEVLEYSSIDELDRFYSYIENDRFFHKHDLQQDPIDFYFDIVCFKGGSGKLKTEVNFEIPTTELTYREENWKHHSRFELFVSILDMDMNEVVSARKMSRLSFKDLDPGRTSLIPAQFTFTVTPGYYRICLEAKDHNSNRRGCYRTSKHLKSMGDALSLSDLLFASSISPAEGNDTFIKGTLRVVPHPMHAYRKPNTIKVYYEIYGLDTDAQDYVFYSVEYSVKALHKRRSGLILKDAGTVISYKYETSAFGAMQRERIEFDTQELWDGVFQLSVTVMDRRTRELTKKVTRFIVIE